LLDSAAVVVVVFRPHAQGLQRVGVNRSRRRVVVAFAESLISHHSFGLRSTGPLIGSSTSAAGVVAELPR
jgi:hypothetical protein